MIENIQAQVVFWDYVPSIILVLHGEELSLNFFLLALTVILTLVRLVALWSYALFRILDKTEFSRNSICSSVKSYIQHESHMETSWNHDVGSWTFHLMHLHFFIILSLSPTFALTHFVIHHFMRQEIKGFVLILQDGIGSLLRCLTSMSFWVFSVKMMWKFCVKKPVFNEADVGKQGFWVLL